MNSDTIKKRKVDNNDHQGRGGGSAMLSTAEEQNNGASMEEFMAEIRLQMNDMKKQLSETNELKSKCEKLESRCRSSESKCEFLEARCGSLERCIELFGKDQTWEYSAPPIPREYWVERGLDDDDIRLMGNFLKQIEDDTYKLRTSQFGYREIILLSTVLYDDALLPHWKEFARYHKCATGTSGA